MPGGERRTEADFVGGIHCDVAGRRGRQRAQTCSKGPGRLGDIGDPSARVEPKGRSEHEPSISVFEPRESMAGPPTPRLTLRLAEAAASLGISRRTLERERSAGRFPKPDIHIGKAPLWTPETLRRWVAEGGA